MTELERLQQEVVDTKATADAAYAAASAADAIATAAYADALNEVIYYLKEQDNVFTNYISILNKWGTYTALSSSTVHQFTSV